MRLLPGTVGVEPRLVLVSVGLRSGLSQHDLELAGPQGVGLVVDYQVVEALEVDLTLTVSLLLSLLTKLDNSDSNCDW